jgi:diguanylate cyclase (GGDEF)-like protein
VGILAVVLVFIIWIGLGFDNQNTNMRSKDLKTLEYMEYKDESTDKYSFSTSVVLNDDFYNEMTLIFRTRHIKVKVYLAGEQIYSFGYEKGSLPFMKSPGSLYNLVELPGHSEGKLLTIYYETPYENFDGVVPKISYGTYGDCEMAYFSSNVLLLVTITLVLIACVIMLVMFIVTRKKKNVISINFLYISGFAFFVSIWVMFQSGALQIFIGNAQMLYFFDLLSLILFPLPIDCYIYSLCVSKEKKILPFFCWAYLGLIVMNLLLQVTGLVDMYQLVICTHLLMLVNILYIIFLMFIEIKREKNVNVRNFLPPIIVIIVAGSIEMFSYYYSNMTSTTAALGIGMVVFMVILVVTSSKRYYTYILSIKETEYFEKLARMDLLTNIANRNRYEEVLEAHKPHEPLTVVMFDLNCLKYINDNFGHSTGDIALKKCAECMKEAFGKAGECYRIGGDEFAVLVNADVSLSDECRKFEELCGNVNNNEEYPFNIAYGVARFDPTQDRTIYDTARRGDFSMYTMKQHQKNNTCG